MLYTNAGEWIVHKYLLHGLGKRKKSFWSFHWHEHHRNSRRNEHIDEAYKRPLFAWHAQSKEALALAAAGAAVAPLLPVAPFFTAGVWYSLVNYYRVHKRSHQDPGWARNNVPWHYDHHMGPNQDANWCVTRPWFDHIMGTRVPYAGTEREARDLARRKEREVRRRQRLQANQAEAAATAPPSALEATIS
jgi:sterol desaturase/sphingolipid hydroxylase (fatty acid hydroxylase superfamily)